MQRLGAIEPVSNPFVGVFLPSEAFLYRRLETLLETRGRFQLNTDLPVAFDGWAEWKSISCAPIRDS